MSTNEVLKEQMQGLSVQEIKELLGTMPEFKNLKIKEAKPAPLKIKANKSGGLYVSSPKFPKLWSENKQKHYQPSLNMAREVAEAIFLDEELLGQIQDFLRNGKTIG